MRESATHDEGLVPLEAMRIFHEFGVKGHSYEWLWNALSAKGFVVSEIESPTRDAVIEECAALIEPKGAAPCGCLAPGTYGGCTCQNTGDLQQEEAYWSSKQDAERIRGLKGKP